MGHNPTPLVLIGSMGEEALHLGINNTKTLVKITPSLLGSGLKEWLGQQASISFVLWISV